MNKKGILSGLIFGILIIIGSMTILWWNENENIESSNMILDARKNVVNVNSSPIDPSNEGKLVSFTGNVTVETENINDPDFNINQKTAKLEKIVEMYQWVKEKTGRVHKEDVFEYKKMWKNEVYSSVGYEEGHNNPDSMPYENKIFLAENVRVGAFILNQDLINQFPTNKNYAIDNNAKLPNGYSIKDNYITNTKNIDEPEIGDIRISYKYNSSEEVSIIAKQTGSTLNTYKFATGKPISKLIEGKLTGNQLITEIQDSNTNVKWILRIVGIVVCIFGFGILFNPISKSTINIPVFGTMAGYASGFIGLLLGIGTSAFVLSIVWFKYKPILSGCFIGFGLLFYLIIISIGRKNKKNIEKGIINPEEEIKKITPEQKQKEEKIKALIDVNDHYVKIVNGVEVDNNNQPAEEPIQKVDNSLDTFMAPIRDDELNNESIIKVDPIKENPALQSLETNFMASIKKEEPKEVAETSNVFAKALQNIPEDELLKSKEFDAKEQYSFEIPAPINVEEKIPTKFEQPKVNIEPANEFVAPVIENIDKPAPFTAPIIENNESSISFTAPVVETEPTPSFNAPIINETQNKLVQDKVNDIVTMNMSNIEKTQTTIQSTPSPTPINDFIPTIETNKKEPVVYKPIDIDSMTDNNGLIPTIVESNNKEN